MKALLAGLTVAILATSLVCVSGVAAQTQAPPQPPAQSAPAPGMDKQLEGQIKSFDPSGKRLTLEDGTEFTIPETVTVSRAELKPGANVKVSYEERGGQKVVKHLEVTK